MRSAAACAARANRRCFVLQTGRTYATACEGRRFAVVLSGCGVYDGSEIQEAVFTLAGISKRGGSFHCFAPDAPQMHVIDHTKGEEMQETRNVLVESARIARGAVAPLANLSSGDWDAVVFPGGFGAAKNLSTFATQGAELTVNADVERVIKDFVAAGKPLGFCCIAPVIAAKVIGGGVQLTVGGDQEGEQWPYAGASGAITAVGAQHVVKPLSEAHTDAKHKVVTAAAYMCGTAKPHGDVLAVESAHGKPGGFALLSDMADHADAEKALAGLDTSCNSVAVLRGVASIFSEASALAVLPTSATCATPDRTPANSGAGATCSPQGGQDLATCSARRTQSTEPSGCSEPVSAGGASVGGPARRGSPAAGRGGLAQDRGELRPPDAGGADAGGAHRRPRPSDADGHAGECVAVKVATDCAGCGQRDCFLRTTSVQGKCCALCITRAEVRCMFCGSEFCTACLTKRERKNAQCVRKEEFGRRGSVLDLTLAGTPAPAAPSAVGAGPYEASEGADEAAEEWRAKDVVWNDTRRQPVPERTVLMNPHAVRWECRRLTWYFAYGSNQNVARFNDRVGTWCARAPLALHGYRLAFNKRSVLAGQAYANVEPAEGCTTYGVGYLIPRGKLELLDRYEGVAGGHYVRKRATFSPVPEGKAVSGVLYVATSEMIRGGLLPSEAYLSDCCGAADLLPDEYMAKLRSHRTAPRY